VDNFAVALYALTEVFFWSAFFLPSLFTLGLSSFSSKLLWRGYFCGDFFFWQRPPIAGSPFFFRFFFVERAGW